MTEIQKLKALAAAMPDLEWDSEFENHEQTGFCSVFAKPFEIDGETHEGPVFVERCTAEQAEFIAGAKEAVLELIAEIERLQAAKATLERLGYSYNGGQLWKPPIGKKPGFDLIDQLKAEVEALRQKAERFAYWKQRAKSAEGHLWASDRAAAFDALNKLKEKGNPIPVASAVSTVLVVLESRRAARLPKDASEGYVWCECGDGYPHDSYGAGFMAANSGVCENCSAAMSKEDGHD